MSTHNKEDWNKEAPDEYMHMYIHIKDVSSKQKCENKMAMIHVQLT